MSEQLKQYEEECMQLLEEKLDREEYEEEYMASKVNLEGKIRQKMRKAEGEEKRSHWRTVGKAAAACVAAVVIMAVSIPDIRAVATDFLHSTLGLQIAGVKNDEKEEASKGNKGFSFEWLMQLTAKEYWEWIQVHELTDGEVPAYVPEGFREVGKDASVYKYLYVENRDMPWSDKKIDPEDHTTYAYFAKVPFSSGLSEAEKRKQVDASAVLCSVARTWKKGQQELWYQREIYDFCELKGHEEAKENAAKKLSINGDEAYIVRENGDTWLYIFGEATLTRLYVDGGIRYDKAENMLVKMAESIQK